MWWGVPCETGSSAVSEWNIRNRIGFGERRGEILRICRYGGRRGATPTLRRCSSSQPPNPDFSVSSSQDEDNNGNVTSQQSQPSQWTLPPKSLRRVVHTFSGAPYGIAVQLHTWEYTPPKILLLLFSEIITFLVVETNRYYSQFLDNSEVGPSPSVR